MTAALGTIYTLEEAADRLRTTPRMVARLARRYGRCARIGREYRFSEGDLAALWDAIRLPAKEPWAHHATKQQVEQAYADIAAHAKKARDARLAARQALRNRTTP
ncbi:helix-turn-helix domain-containing protein [Ancylobacter oerskovii]|uniref:Helix-turn-helix domain-containing protein n=1 Tax=Ancylobacter oerskovii TaxID=459519 RepID=A0ABW4Z351_9HYPH|nr:helix-turn-helix domain-containing protein [Ancylobacter oerskovii]